MGRRRVRMTNKPSYRFEDYAEPWEQRKLGEIVDITSGDAPAKFFEGNTPYVKVDDLNYCDKYLTATQNHVDTSYKIKKIEKGSVVFPKRGAAILTNKIRILNVQAYMDTNMMSLNTDKANLEFLYTVISNIGLYKIADTSTIPQINNKHILPYPIFFPTLPEQTAIGSFFQEIDQLISLQQRKLEVLKEQKKTYLNLLFPTIGQKKPALRFAGFEDEWSNAMLGDIAELYQPQTISSKELLTEGFPVFGANGYIGYYKDYNHKEDQVTISARGEGTGTPSFVEGPVWITGNSMVVNVEHQENIIKSFLYAFCLSFDFKPFVTGGAQPQLTREILKKVNIMLPTLSEQKVIGSFFQDLDKVIAKQEEKVNQLKESKQTLLRKMFI